MSQCGAYPQCVGGVSRTAPNMPDHLFARVSWVTGKGLTSNARYHPRPCFGSCRCCDTTPHIGSPSVQPRCSFVNGYHQASVRFPRNVPIGLDVYERSNRTTRQQIVKFCSTHHRWRPPAHHFCFQDTQQVGPSHWAGGTWKSPTTSHAIASSCRKAASAPRMVALAWELRSSLHLRYSETSTISHCCL